MQWVLILTMLSPNYAAVTSVPGFVSEAACTDAGLKWGVSLPKTKEGQAATFACVEQPARA